MVKDKYAIGDAIMCANDRIAFGVLSALHSMNLMRHPGNDNGISVAGHDNVPLSEFTYPSLTTVEQDVKSIGEHAVQIIMSQLGNIATLTNTKQSLPAKLIIRESA
ncbi:MAG: substrate-binding domain-containing protein [Ostreibacterium sp.]